MIEVGLVARPPAVSSWPQGRVSRATAIDGFQETRTDEHSFAIEALEWRMSLTGSSPSQRGYHNVEQLVVARLHVRVRPTPRQFAREIRSAEASSGLARTASPPRPDVDNDTQLLFPRIRSSCFP